MVVVEEVEALIEACVNDAVVCVGNSSRSCGYCGRSLQLPSVDSVDE